MSDSQLQKAVLDELEWEPSVNAAHIGVIALDQASSTAWAAPGTTSVDTEIAVI